MNELPRLTRTLLDQLGVDGLRRLADLLPDSAASAHPSLAALVEAAGVDGVARDVAAAYVRGRCDGVDDAWRTQGVEVVWTGPGSAAVPVRATAAVLVDLIAAARFELVLMTYSARRHDGIRTAVTAAAARGVAVDVIVETLAGAAGAIGGSEPAAAFAGLPGVTLWHWPTAKRSTPSAKMHAKVAIADESALLISSANLTHSGGSDNLEAGLLVRGGNAPSRALEYVRDLQQRKVVVRLPTQM